MKSYTILQLVPKLVTLNDLQPRNSRLFRTISPKAVAFGANCVELLKLYGAIPVVSVTQNVATRFYSFWHYVIRDRASLLIFLSPK